MNKKGKIWVFGDSNAAPINNSGLLILDTIVEYIEHIGETYKHFGTLLSEEFNMDVELLGKLGGSNYCTLDQIGKNIHKINPNKDKVVIILTEVTRFRLKFAYELTPICVNGENNTDNFDKETIERILVERSDPLYVKELNSLVNILLHTFKDVDLMFITPFKELENEKYVLNMNKAAFKYDLQLPSILMETGGKVKDMHLGKLGNLNLSKLLSILFREDRNKIKELFNIT